VDLAGIGRRVLQPTSAGQSAAPSDRVRMCIIARRSVASNRPLPLSAADAVPGRFAQITFARAASSAGRPHPSGRKATN
jgi:hypothetical protein